MAKPQYATITEVHEDSPAYRSGFRAGDRLVSINARPIHDVLDCRFHGADEVVTVEVLRDDRPLKRRIRKDIGEDLGLEFGEELFGGVRKCVNKCVFCFLRQMPKGMRPSLYVRDDDYRLSFAHGNYITLTNLTEEDMDRICSQKMSPLYVSVHTTEPDLRVMMLGSKRAGHIMDQLHRFAKARITLHTQIVLCPGINDGVHLERTVRDLSSLFPAVASIAVVPVGLTRHREGLMHIEPAGCGDALHVLDQCGAWQKEFRKQLGTRLVFPSDEFYILAERPFPSTRAYEGFPQLEDGIGVSRLFLDDLARAVRRLERLDLRPGSYVLVTGVLASELLGQLADFLNDIPGIECRVHVVENRFFGPSVTVAGLLTGKDIACSLADCRSDDEVLVPSISLKDGVFLDDMTIGELAGDIGTTVSSVEPMPSCVLRHMTRRWRAVSSLCRAGT